MPVVVEPLAPEYVPDEAGALGILVVGDGQERRILPLQELRRRAGIPVGHRAEVCGDHESARKGVVREELAQFAPVLEPPAGHAVVEALHVVVRRRGRVGIGDDLRERLLPRVVHADARHEAVETALQAPVDLPLPFLRPPLFRLKARKTSMREVADRPILEARLLADVESGEVDPLAVRNLVSVPEPAAPGSALQQIVDAVEERTPVRAGDRDAVSVRADRIRIVSGL